MYYDRRIPETLLALLLPGGALQWLLPWVRSEKGASALAHVQLRRDHGGRRNGGIQLYFGRTSPLEIKGSTSERIGIKAHRFYQALSPDLFQGPRSLDELRTLQPRFEEHLDAAAAAVHRNFVDGEAVLHAGLLRRHGPLATSAEPWVAVDSEAQIGFDRLADQQLFNEDLRRRVGLATAKQLPKKLDVVGLDTVTGALLLVEVKADSTGLNRAAWQAAAHVARFQALVERSPVWARDSFAGMIADRVRLGLLPRGTSTPSMELPSFVPVIAARDDGDQWASRWAAQIAPIQAATPGLLNALRLWRLSEDGTVLDERRMN